MKRMYLYISLTLASTATIVWLAFAQAKPAAPSFGEAPRNQAYSLGGDMPGKQMRPSPEALARLLAPLKAADEFVKEAEALMGAGDYEAAEQRAKVGLEATPDRAKGSLFLVLGDIYMRTDQFEKAIASFEAASGLVSRTGQEFDLAVCYMELGQIGQAMNFYSDDLILKRHALLREADLPTGGAHQGLRARMLFGKGLSCALSGGHEEALYWYGKAAEADPGNGLAHFQSGRSCEYLYRRQDAKAHYAIAADLCSGWFADEANRLK